MNINTEIDRKIKEKALAIGFSACGIAKADFLEEEAPRLEEWLKKNMHGQMAYMANHFDKRLDPRKLVEGAQSVITVLQNYYTTEKPAQTDTLKISKYAYGTDYHFVIKEKLNLLLEYIRQETGEVNGRAFVDSAPVLDKAWAKKTGLGWIGKNSNLLTRFDGSFVFIGHLIIDTPLPYDNEIVSDHCGSCTRCIDACPTEAIVKPYVVDGSKCISYFTIELKDALPESVKGKFNDWIFGCDICQDVCPYNRWAKPHKEPQFAPHPDLLHLKPDDWQNLNQEAFSSIFRKSAVKRTKYSGLMRNIKFVLNSKSEK